MYKFYMSQNFRLFLASNLSVLNFRFFLLMYPGSLASVAAAATVCFTPVNQLFYQMEEAASVRSSEKLRSGWSDFVIFQGTARKIRYYGRQVLRSSYATFRCYSVDS